MTSAGYPLQIEPLDRGESFGKRLASQDALPVSVALHAATYGRLRERLTRSGLHARDAGDFVLHGPLGMGKSVLLRRMYWDLFGNQDEIAPLLHRVPSGPFRPARWARRFALEAVQQWIAWERGDERLASRGVLPASELKGLCLESRLAPLARFLDVVGALDMEDGAEAALSAFEGLAAAAEECGRCVSLLIDEGRHGHWRDGESRMWLTRLTESGSVSPSLRRVWALRHGPGRRHPFLVPQPDVVEDFELTRLGEAAALAFVERVAARSNLRYDPGILRDFLHLWGGTPAWLAHFVGEASSLPRDVNSEEMLIDAYVADVSHGATSRMLEQSLTADGAEVLAPERVAEVAETALAWDGPGTSESGGAGSQDDEALARLAMAGVAVPAPRGWRVSSAPVLRDFLRLFVTRYYHGRNLKRNEVALKRHRLVEQAHRVCEGAEAEDTYRRLSIFLHAMQGQSVPREHFAAHRRTTASETVPGSLSEAMAGKWVELPHALGVFEEEPVGSRGEDRLVGPGVVAWCFDEPGFYRSDESAWVLYPCDASVITSEELEEVSRRVRRLSRELGVGRVVAWLLGDGRYSPEAAERIEASEGLLASTWTDFDKLGETVVRTEGLPSLGRGGGAEAASRRRPRIVREASSSALGEQVVEIYLPPTPDMELSAAQSVEELAREAGYDEQTAGEIRMATLEACLNAIERSRNAEKEVYVRLSASRDKFTVLVENEGACFDPQSLESPDLESKKGSGYKRGWGVALMQKFMDRVVYEPYDRGTRLRMTKRNATPGVPRERVERETASHE